jgi:hypothetical protein
MGTSGLKRSPAHNRRLAKVAVQCSADSFVVNQSLVLRMSICGEYRHLRQAPNRCAICYVKPLKQIKYERKNAFFIGRIKRKLY